MEREHQLPGEGGQCLRHKAGNEAVRLQERSWAAERSPNEHESSRRCDCQKTNVVQDCISRSVVCKVQEVTMLLCLAVVKRSERNAASFGRYVL